MKHKSRSNEDQRQVQDGFRTWRSVFEAIVHLATPSAKSTGPDVCGSLRNRNPLGIRVRPYTFYTNVAVMCHSLQ